MTDLTNRLRTTGLLLLQEAATEITQLREALAPFADASEELVDDNSYRDHDHIWEAPAALSITYGDLRRARRALKDNPNG